MEDAGAGFVVREHGRNPRVVKQRAWRACGRVRDGARIIQLHDLAGL